MTACFYCPEPILPGQDVVHGVKVVAHRACVHKELDGYNPKWRLQVDHPTGRRPGRTSPRGPQNRKKRA